jgi:hypothetical protein
VPALHRTASPKFGPEPDGAHVRVKRNEHDLGTYMDIVIEFDGTNEAAREYAIKWSAWWMGPTCSRTPRTMTFPASSINGRCACAESARSSPNPHRARVGLAREVVDQLLDKASRGGAMIALLFSDMSPEHWPAGFEVFSMTEAELKVTESCPSRRSHDTDPWRRGTRLGGHRSHGTDPRRPISVPSRSRRRLCSVRDYEETMLAGLGQPGARQLHFFDR